MAEWLKGSWLRAGAGPTILVAATLSAATGTIAVSIDARAIQPGELVVVTIATGKPVAHVSLRAFGHETPAFPISDREWHGLIGIDLDVRPGTYAVAVEAGGPGTATERASRDLVVGPKAFRTRRLSVDEAFVTPPPSAAERIAADAQLLERVWSSSATARLWSGPFARPVQEAANSAFGTRSIFNGKPRNAHGGADFLSPAGTPVHAPAGGRVAVARALYYSGDTVVIDHGLGLFSTLAHLSVIDVKEGDRIDTGQVIGQVGATGRVTGPHLHWATRVAGARVDPLSILALLGKSNEF